MKKKLLISLGFIALLAVGYGIGYFLGGQANSPDKTVGSDDFSIFEAAISVIGIFLSLIFSFYLHIIVHEAGHLVAGVATNHRFISFRILSFTLIRQQGRLRLTHFNIPGTGGQCLMSPPAVYLPSAFSWYISGGVLANLGLSLLCLIGFLVTDGVMAHSFFMLCGMVGVICIVFNWLPLKLGGVPNDGYHFWYYRNDSGFLRGFASVLQIYAKQSDGQRLANMPDELIVRPELNGKMSPEEFMMTQIFVNRCFEKDDFQMTHGALVSMEDAMTDVPQIYRWEWSCEMIFCELMLHGNTEKSKRLYSRDLKGYISKSHSFQMPKIRLMIALKVIADNDLIAGQKLKQQALRLSARYPNQGEAAAELELIERVIASKSNSRGVSESSS